MTEYNPDSWAILRMTWKDETIYKVLAGWSGSYLYGSSWRLNSGIVRAEETEDAWVFTGSTGSTYRCPKGRYGLALSTSDIYRTMIERYSSQVMVMENCDWSKFDFGVNNVEV